MPMRLTLSRKNDRFNDKESKDTSPSVVSSVETNSEDFRLATPPSQAVPGQMSPQVTAWLGSWLDLHPHTLPHGSDLTALATLCGLTESQISHSLQFHIDMTRRTLGSGCNPVPEIARTTGSGLISAQNPSASQPRAPNKCGKS